MSTTDSNHSTEPPAEVEPARRGAAFRRVIAALEAHGRGPRVYGSGAATAHCPGPGHYRDDVHPSLTIAPGNGKVLISCHALCNTEDVLKAVGLTLADLFNEPRKPRPGAPATRQLRHAIGKARGLADTDRYVYLWLLGLADFGTAAIPARFQPHSQRTLAEECGANRMTVQQSVAHLARHGWLAVSCGAPGCQRPEPHRGRGHKTAYSLPGIGEDCPGDGCRFRCRPSRAARRAHLKLLSGTMALTAVTLLAVGGAGSPPSTCLQHKPASDLRRSVPIAAFYECRLQPFTAGAAP